jgi:RNA polymerase sigma-70 factor (ECF subfamily)
VRSREGADDATQDAFERFFRYLDRVDPERPLAPWLHRIVVNCSLTALQRGGRSEALVSEPVDGGQEARIEATRDVRDLLSALGRLDGDRRAVVVVRLFLGYSTEEAAEMLGVAVGTVGSRLASILGRRDRSGSDELRQLR